MHAGWVGSLILAALLCGCAPETAPQASPDPAAFQARLDKGVDLLQKREYPAAARTFREALALAPASAPAHNFLGVACLRNGDFALAGQAFQKAAALDPKRAAYRSNFAATCYLLHQYPRAKEAYLAAITAEPDFAPSYYGLCNVLLVAGAPEEGCRYLAKGLDLDPGFLERQGDLMVGRREPFVGHTPGLLDYARTVAGAGNAEGTLALLEMAEKTGFQDWSRLKGLPELDRVKAEPRIQALLQRH